MATFGDLARICEVLGSASHRKSVPSLVVRIQHAAARETRDEIERRVPVRRSALDRVPGPGATKRSVKAFAGPGTARTGRGSAANQLPLETLRPGMSARVGASPALTGFIDPGRRTTKLGHAIGSVLAPAGVTAPAAAAAAPRIVATAERLANEAERGLL